MKRFLGALAVISTALVLAGSPAGAHSAVNIHREASTTWVHGSFDGDYSSIEIKVISKDGGRTSLWQKCTFDYSGAGSYRCGIDTAEGSLADLQAGSWVAKISADGTPLARQSFRI
jgi:hypothetical protein